MKKLLLIIIIAGIVGGGSFYGGMKYNQSKISEGFKQEGLGEFRNFPSEANIGSRFRGGQFRSEEGERTEFVSGKIISKDNQSITIELPDGGSKIIFYAESTEISKFVNGAPNDFEIGKLVTVNGETNEDGSITAKLVQLRAEIN